MKSESYSNFWQRIRKGAKKNCFPLRVMFEATYRCNFYCRHCYVPQSYRDYNELKTKEVFCILDQLADIGCFYLGFTGGEPFLRKDIIPILWYAKRKGFEIIIYTNGSLIDEKVAGELAHLRPNKVDITIPAMSKIAFERISGLSGSQDKVFRAIELLRAKGVNLGFKTCVLKENEFEIKDIQKFAESLGALHRLDDMLSPCLDGSREPYRFRGQMSDVRIEKNELLNCQTAKLPTCSNETNCQSPINQLTNHQELFKCGVGVSQAAITPLGELKMCLMIDYPKYRILETSLKNCWQRLKELIDNIKPDEDYKCDSCKLKDSCKWCPAKGWLYNRSFSSCEPENRKKAELIRGLLNC